MDIDYEKFQEAMDYFTLALGLVGDHPEVDLIIAPSRGGLIPGAVLSHRMGVKVIPIEFSTRDFIGTSLSTLSDYLDITPNPVRHVLIAEDIVDSGKTLNDLRVAIREQFAYRSYTRMPKISSAAVVTNSALSHTLQPDYQYFTIDRNTDDKFVNFWWEQT